MFLFHIAFSAGLLALGLGTCILIWGHRDPGTCARSAKLVGWVISIAASISIVCTVYFGFLYWFQGECPMSAGGCPMMQQGMQRMDAPMMQKMHEQKTN